MLCTLSLAPQTNPSTPSLRIQKTMIFILILCFALKTNSSHLQNQRNLQQLYINQTKSLSQTYCGITTINNDMKNNDKLSKIRYYVSFSRWEDGCNFKNCYYGYVHNYTVKGDATVQGYPRNMKAVFSFRINTKQDYVIERHPEVEDGFADIIEVSCELFQPSLQEDLQRPAGSQYDNFRFAPLSQFQRQNPQSLLAKGASSDAVFAASVSAPLLLTNIESKQSSFKQEILVNQDYKILSRNKQVDLNLPTDKFGQEPTNNSLLSKINVRFDHVIDQEIDHSSFQQYIEDLKQFNGRQEFTFEKISNKRSGLNYYKEVVTEIQSLSKSPEIVVPSTTIAEDTGNQLLGACSLTNSSSTKPIFYYQKVLVEKTILGKKFLVTLIVDAIMATGNSARYKGTIIYNLFDAPRSAQIFNNVQAVNLNWGKTYNMTGTFPAQTYMGLPYPVAFLGINFRFTVYVSLSINVYAKSDGRISSNCLITFEVGANVGTSVRVSAAASVQATAIEGGVYITGTLVSLGTNPKLVTTYNVSTKAVSRTVLWYLYIYAFQFEWGFYYRTWGYWSGWSDYNIIASWPIYNGYTQTYLIYRG